MATNFFFTNGTWSNWFRRGISRIILGKPGKFGNGLFRNYFQINQRTTIVQTENLTEVAAEHSALNTILSRGAELFSLGKLKHVDKDGNDIEDSELLKSLANPNVAQTLKEFLYEFYMQNGIYNKTFQHLILGNSFEQYQMPIAIWLLPTELVRIKVTGKTYRQVKIENVIEGYEVAGDDEPLKSNRVIFMKEGVCRNLFEPVSKIEALKIPLSNFQAALKSYNIITTERGQIGYISSDPGADNFGKKSLDENETKRLRKEYQDISSLDSEGGHINFTHSNVKWVPLTFDVNQLQLFPGLEQAFGQLCDAFGIRRDLFAAEKGATYENQKEAKKGTIEDGITPLAERLAESWTDAFCDPAKGAKLLLCYDHLACMKDDELKKEQARKTKAEANEIMLTNGVINHDAFAEDMEVKMTGDKKIIQRSQPNIQPNA